MKPVKAIDLVFKAQPMIATFILRLAQKPHAQPLKRIGAVPAAIMPPRKLRRLRLFIMREIIA